MAERKGMTYSGTGVDYDLMDPFKRLCQLAGRATAGNIERLNGGEFREFEPSRGESAYLIEAMQSFFAHVEEGLGTKNLVADAMYVLNKNGRSYYNQVAQDTVAMIVNDMVTVGALPLSVEMHLAAGSSEWFLDKQRYTDLIDGWKKACDLARCVWGGGETPTLKDIVSPETVVLAGSAMGIVKPKDRLILSRICSGDSIVIFESSGIGANGLTLARKIGAKVGYLAILPNGRTYGETLLDPTHIYVGLIEDCLNAGVNIHYAVNITGHGWRKLMRAQEPFTYVIEQLPRQLPIFDYIQEHGPVDDREAYGNLNMGAGFAIYVPANQVQKVLNVAQQSKVPFNVFEAGYIKEGEKKVLILPKRLEYAGSTLGVR